MGRIKKNNHETTTVRINCSQEPSINAKFCVLMFEEKQGIPQYLLPHQDINYKGKNKGTPFW